MGTDDLEPVCGLPRAGPGAYKVGMMKEGWEGGSERRVLGQGKAAECRSVALRLSPKNYLEARATPPVFMIQAVGSGA